MAARRRKSRAEEHLPAKVKEGTGVEKYLEVCERAARLAGRVLADWAGKFAVKEKGPADLVTEADLAAQEVIRDCLLGEFPEHGFLGEEGNSVGGKQGWTWIVDPLDGTTNYVHGLPAYCVSIALAYQGKLQVGTVFDPVANECFSALAGRGAFLNGNPIRGSAQTRLDRALVAVSFPPQLRLDSPQIRDFIAVMLEAQAIRRMGSSALNLAYLANGRYDAFWATETKAWDVAAGVLLVREAGGIVTGLHGAEFDLEEPRVIATASPELHKALLAALAKGANLPWGRTDRSE